MQAGTTVFGTALRDIIPNANKGLLGGKRNFNFYEAAGSGCANRRNHCLDVLAHKRSWRLTEHHRRNFPLGKILLYLAAGLVGGQELLDLDGGAAVNAGLGHHPTKSDLRDDVNHGVGRSLTFHVYYDSLYTNQP